MNEFNYSGNELDVFATARNWKAYWSDEIRQYVGDDVLEIGAGIGSTAKTLAYKPYKRWVGVEPDQRLCAAIEQEISKGTLPQNFTLVNGTLASLDGLKDFDTVLYIDVLEHIEHDRSELAAIQEKVRPGGRIIILSPAHMFLFSEFDRKIGHYRRYDKKQLTSIVPSGLKVEQLCYLDSVGLLASLGNRLLLHSADPTLSQVQLWDRVMVRLSRVVDKVTLHRWGKTVLCVLTKVPADAAK